jgi:hypothetical protein
MKTIEVIVLPTGETKVQTRGFAGGECREASKFLERALGNVGSDRLTDEFFQQTATTQSIAAGGSP